MHFDAQGHFRIFCTYSKHMSRELQMMDANANSQGHKREGKNASNDAKFRASAPLKTRLFLLQSQGNFFLFPFEGEAISLLTRLMRPPSLAALDVITSLVQVYK